MKAQPGDRLQRTKRQLLDDTDLTGFEGANTTKMKYPKIQYETAVGSRDVVENNHAASTWRTGDKRYGLTRQEIVKKEIAGAKGVFNEENLNTFLIRDVVQPDNTIKKGLAIQKRSDNIKSRYISQKASDGAKQRNNWIRYVRRAVQFGKDLPGEKWSYTRLVADPIFQAMYHRTHKAEDNRVVSMPFVPESIFAFDPNDRQAFYDRLERIRGIPNVNINPFASSAQGLQNINTFIFGVIRKIKSFLNAQNKDETKIYWNRFDTSDSEGTDEYTYEEFLDNCTFDLKAEIETLTRDEYLRAKFPNARRQEVAPAAPIAVAPAAPPIIHAPAAPIAVAPAASQNSVRSYNFDELGELLSSQASTNGHQDQGYGDGADDQDQYLPLGDKISINASSIRRINTTPEVINVQTGSNSQMKPISPSSRVSSYHTAQSSKSKSSSLSKSKQQGALFPASGRKLSRDDIVALFHKNTRSYITIYHVTDIKFIQSKNNEYYIQVFYPNNREDFEIVSKRYESDKEFLGIFEQRGKLQVSFYLKGISEETLKLTNLGLENYIVEFEMKFADFALNAKSYFYKIQNPVQNQLSTTTTVTTEKSEKVKKRQNKAEENIKQKTTPSNSSTTVQTENMVIEALPPQQVQPILEAVAVAINRVSDNTTSRITKEVLEDIAGEVVNELIEEVLNKLIEEPVEENEKKPKKGRKSNKKKQVNEINQEEVDRRLAAKLSRYGLRNQELKKYY